MQALRAHALSGLLLIDAIFENPEQLIYVPCLHTGPRRQLASRVRTTVCALDLTPRRFDRLVMYRHRVH